MTLRTGIMMLKIQLLNTGINFKIDYNRKDLFKIAMIFQNIIVFTVSNKCSFHEHK